MEKIKEIYEQKTLIQNDINEHLSTLLKYSTESDVIVELGVRSIVSTWAFLFGKPKKLISIDIVHPSKYINHDPLGCNIELVDSLAKENDIDFEFILEDSLKVNLPECDLIFFDTLHTYNQLKKELELHAIKCKKYLIFHDTVSFATTGEVKGEEGIGRAISEFLEQNTNWIVEEVFTNNNGLTILKRK